MAQWLTWAGQFLAFTVGTVDGMPISLGLVLAMALLAYGVSLIIGAVLSAISR